MSSRNTVLTPASIAFGVLVAVLAVLDSPALVPFAIVGGIGLGVLYALSGRTAEPGASRRRARNR